MKREVTAAIVGTIALFVILAITLPTLLEEPSFVELSEIDVQSTPQPVIISKTALEILYEDNPDSMITIDADSFPVTTTCELRKGGGEGTLASQDFVKIAPCLEEYPDDPVLQVITLTWTLSQPLVVGWYEEFCKLEAHEGVYGYLTGGSPDGNNYFMVNHWQIEPNKCILPVIIRNRP
jgi:hypothetical protein